MIILFGMGIVLLLIGETCLGGEFGWGGTFVKS